MMTEYMVEAIRVYEALRLAESAGLTITITPDGSVTLRSDEHSFGTGPHHSGPELMRVVTKGLVYISNERVNSNTYKEI